MFFPEAMTETQLIVPEKDLLAVTHVLTGQGTFHQVDASYLSSAENPGGDDSWKERAATYSALERQISASMQALAVPEGHPYQVDQGAMLEIETVRPLVEQIERDVKSAHEQLTASQKNLAQLQNDIHQLEPVAEYDLDIGLLREPHYIHSILGSLPNVNLERLETSLARIPYVLLVLRKERDNSVVWLTGAKFNADILERAARSAYLNPLDLGAASQGTPTEIIKTLNAEIQKIQAEIENQQAKISSLHEAHQHQLQALLWQVRASRLLADAMARFGRLNYTYLIIGWVPSSKLESLSQQLKQASKNIVIELTPSSQRGEKSQNVPVALQNPGMLGSFQQLVTTYARPRYEEIDPTVLITITFPLLFGAMFGDVGHGLVLALFGALLASRRVPALRSLAGLGTIVTTCGLVATLFGFLYGSIFGLETVIPALWIRPMENITEILGIAIGGGIVILSLGFFLNLYNAWRAQDWGRFFFDPNGVVGLVLFWSLLGLAAGAFIKTFPIPAPVFAVTAILGAMAVMFSEILKHLVEGHRPLFEGGLGIYAIQAVVELFEKLISFLSNSLSYVRVGAFAVAHAGLSAVIYILAQLVSPGHGVGYWIVAILGNLFIVGFEGLIVGIQTMRLEYYEFFSKFFTGGGKPYEPLTTLPRGES
jgi:V/A-type H+-transporting ATPase subunit I